MADYTGDIVGYAPSEYTPQGGVVDALVPSYSGYDEALGGFDLWWLFGPPPVPPAGVPAPQPIQAVICDLGRDELAKLLGDLGGAAISYFRFGEGGWLPSSDHTEQTGLSPGGKTVVSQTLRAPVYAGSVSVTVGLQTVVDDGAGGFTGLGTGTINYKTGAFTITFDQTTVGGTPILATYRTWGRESEWVEEDWEHGLGTSGPYSGTLSGTPVIPGTVVVWDGDTQYLADDGVGNLVDEAPGGTGTGTIDYTTGDIVATFEAAVETDFPVRATYRYYRQAKQPARGQVDLEAVDESLFSIQKSLELTDMVFQGTGTGRVRITCTLDADEGNDDGSGEAPVYYEGGLYTSNDVLVMYLTWPGAKKTSSGALTRVVDLVV